MLGFVLVFVVSNQMKGEEIKPTVIEASPPSYRYVGVIAVILTWALCGLTVYSHFLFAPKAISVSAPPPETNGLANDAVKWGLAYNLRQAKLHNPMGFCHAVVAHYPSGYAKQTFQPIWDVLETAGWDLTEHKSYPEGGGTPLADGITLQAERHTGGLFCAEIYRQKYHAATGNDLNINVSNRGRPIPSSSDVPNCINCFEIDIGDEPKS